MRPGTDSTQLAPAASLGGGAAPRGPFGRETGLALAAAFLIAVSARPAHAYIGPGAGFAVLGSFLVVVAAVVLGGLVLVTYPLRLLVRLRRRRRAYAKSQVNRVVVLGFDGLDPEIAEAMIEAGRLPNLAKLRDRGSFVRLGTSCPAMSPVAWSSFMTGAGPGRHGIFDFLHRDPRTYLPDLSSAQIRPPHRQLKLGRLILPLGRPVLRQLRRSKPFWTVLGEHGIFSTVLRVPITFPPERFNGLLLSGMCVPDLRGTQGSFTFFTSSPDAHKAHIGGERRLLTRVNGRYTGELPGPPRPGDGQGLSKIPLEVRPLGDGRARLDIGRERLDLRPGEYTDWVPLSFQLGPGMRANGISRFYLRQLEPDVELYVSPINIDPEQPALPVSHPSVYSVYLSKRLGRYATLGLAEDTWALNESVLDDASFLAQCDLMFEERKKMLSNALENGRSGCIVCVFDTTDRVQHMYWRYREPGHPAPVDDPALFAQTIERSYEQADAVVGTVAAQLGERDVLFVMSDHGFKSFRRGLNLNAWLLEQGYLHLQPDASGEEEWLAGVDWDRTRAYALGLGGLYLNVRGREAHGVVPPEQADELKAELIAKLTGLQDPQTGDTAIRRALDTRAVNPGPYAEVGPDLTIGYGVGYRASWSAAQGQVAGPVLEDNTRRWSGDHCLDPELVPGVLFSSLPLPADEFSIRDLAPTILELFGVKPPAYMEGRSLLVGEEKEAVAGA